jgi:hypothetical protein
VHYSSEFEDLTTDLIDCINESDLNEKIEQTIKGNLALKNESSGKNISIREIDI